MYRVVVVLKGLANIHTRFRKLGDAKYFRKLLKANLNEKDYKYIHIVDVKKARPPSDKFERPTRGHTWCPYCRRWRTFLRDGYGILHCECCGISDGDFHVKQYMMLDRPISKKKRKRKKRKRNVRE